MRGFLPTVTVALTFVLFCMTAYSEDRPDDVLEKLLSGKPDVVDRGKTELLAQRERQIGRLLEIVNDATLKKNRAAFLAAVEVLGELRAEQAAPALTRFLLVGKKMDIHDRYEDPAIRALPHHAAPTVQALVSIGTPSLKPVTEQLVAITERTRDKYTLQLHCHWVIKGVLGPRLGKAYLTQLCERDPRARDSAFVKEGFDFMDLFMKFGKDQ